MRISILIPCYNEEATIAGSINSCLRQTRKLDQIVVVNDGSTDKSKEVILGFGEKITLLDLEKNTGNKSHAQEAGLKLIDGDIFIMTDADTILHENFVEEVERSFLSDPSIEAVAGYIISLRHNWLTACRQLEYAIGQDVYKTGQWNIGGISVIPGCAGAFRTDSFRKYIQFDHDTLTEDLDFTYKLHANNLRIEFNKKAIAYTQDPPTLKSYINQVRRWLGGGWQNFLKHRKTVFRKPALITEIFLPYAEGLASAVVILSMPFIDLGAAMFMGLSYLATPILIGIYASIKMRNISLLYYSPLYIIAVLLNLYIFLEQFIKEVVIREKNMNWYKPERKALR